MKLLAATSLALFLFAGSARSESGQTKKADALFREGRALMQDGDFARACNKLEQSYRLDPAAGTAVNLGDCFDRINKVGSALLAYRAAKKLLTNGDPRTAPVGRQIDALLERVPRLTITLAPDAPEGTSVTRDGKDVAGDELGAPLIVNPGRVIIVVTAPGREKVRTVLSVAERDRRTFVADVGDPEGDAGESAPRRRPENARSTAREPRGGSSSRSTGLVLGGIGVAGLATGIVTALMANSKEDEASTRCPNDQCTQDGFDAAQSGKTLNTISYIGWGIGIVGVATGGYLLFLTDPDESPAVVAATADANGASLVARGTFW